MADDVIKNQLEHVLNEMREVLAANAGSTIIQVSARRELAQWYETLELVRRGLGGDAAGRGSCTNEEHHSIPGLDRCYCGGFDLRNGIQRVGPGGRPVVWAAIARVNMIGTPVEARCKFGEGFDGIAVELPPNCSINLDVDLHNGGAPAPPFIRVIRGPSGVEIREEDGDGRG